MSGPKKKAEDAAINDLRARNIDPLPPWKSKRRKKEIEIPSMPCLAAMLLSDPFVVRLLLDKVLRALRVDVLKGKCLPAGNHMLPSMMQVLNIAQFSTQICAVKGRKIIVPDAGLQNLSPDGGSSESDKYIYELPHAALRSYLSIFAKLLLDSDLDRRMAIGGDLEDAALQAVLARSEVHPEDWAGTSSLHSLRVLVEGALVNLLQVGNSNDAALKHQFPRFVAALDALSGGDMLNERPFCMSLVHALMRHKLRLAHGTRDLVTGCMIQWLKMGYELHPSRAICSPLHECFMHLLNEWSALGNLVLPRDLFLSLAEEAIAAVVGEESSVFGELWAGDSDHFSPVKAQYVLMLTSTPDAKANEWKEKIGIE